MLRRPEATLALTLALAAGCGARDALRVDGDDTTGAGAAGASGSTSPSTPASTGTGAQAPCNGFAVDGEAYPIPVGQNATEPEVGAVPDGRLFVAWRMQNGSLAGDATIDLDAWPHAFESIQPLAPDVTAFVTGPGVDGPVAYVRDPFGEAGLARDLFTGAPIVSAFVTNGAPLFVIEIQNRVLYATNEGSFLNVGAYADPGTVATHGPSICLGTKMLGSAISKNDHAVVAYADSIAPGQSCFAQVPQPGMSLVTKRYEVTGSDDASFNLVDVETLVQPEPLFHLELASTGFGAYVVFQTDGSTSEVMPPISAYLLDHGGALQPAGAGPIAVSPSGVSSQSIAVASMDDDLVVAWVDALDPTAPTIIVRRVRSDGTVVAETAVDTSPAWLFGKLRMVTSRDQASLLLAWTADVDKTVGVAKVSCTP